MPEFTVPNGIHPLALDAFLEVLITGGNMDHALRQTDGDGLELRRFARQCGFPSRQPMREARAALRELYPEIAGVAAPAAQPEHDDSPAIESAKAAHPSQPAAIDLSPVVLAIAPAPADDHDDQDPVPHAAILKEAVHAVARAATDSGSKSIAAAGERFVKAHDALVQALRAHAEDAAKADRIAALQAELARLRGKTPTAASPAAPQRTDHSKAVRAWAAEQGIECPKVGRVPQRIHDAYDAAHQVA